MTSLEASRAILARSGQGAAAGDGLEICKALQVVAFVAFDLLRVCRLGPQAMVSERHSRFGAC